MRMKSILSLSLMMGLSLFGLTANGVTPPDHDQYQPSGNEKRIIHTQFGIVDMISPDGSRLIVNDESYFLGIRTRIVGTNGELLSPNDLTPGTPVHITTKKRFLIKIKVLSEIEAENIIRNIQEKEPWRFR